MTTTLFFDSKAPTDTDQFFFDWTAKLAGATISSAATTTLPSDLTVGVVQIQGPIVATWLSSGVAGTTYTVTNSVLTSDNRTLARSATLYVESK